MDFSLFIPIVAIICTFAVPITALVIAYRRRKMVFEERRAMIERGMELPALEEQDFDFGKWRGDPAARRERSLRAGVSMTFLGIGLGTAAWLSLHVLEQSLIPHRAVGFMTMGAAIVTFLGIGNLVYYAVSAKRGSPPAP
jgi:Domain of unknown function (DUF6249)